MAYPTDLDALADNVDDVLADHVNELQKKVGIGDSDATAGAEGQVLTRTPTAGETLYSDAPILSSLFRQALINSNFDVWQELTTFDAGTTPANDNDVYIADGWILLSDGDDIVDVSRDTDAPDGSAYAIKFQVETANKKFGILQVIENVDALKLDDKNVSISFQAKTTTAKLIENLRVVVLAWDGAADVVTSDVIAAWAVEGTNPTWAANWTAENTPANKAITTSWAKYSVPAIAIDTAGMTNIAVFIWVDDTDAAVDDELFISQVELCEGDIPLPYQPKSFADEFISCQRFYERSYNYGIAAGTTTATGAEHGSTNDGGITTGTLNSVRYQTPKRIASTISIYGTGGTIDTINDGDADRAKGVGSFATGSSINGFHQDYTLDSETAVSRKFHWLANSRL